MQKSWDSLDKGRCVVFLRVYGLGTTPQRLIQRYWDKKKVVPKDEIYFGRPFRMARGVTKRGPFFMAIFNIVVDAVVREFILEVCRPQEAHHGFGWSDV